MADIKIDTIGKIVHGKECGKFIKIIDDSKNTGGFLILTSDDHQFRQGANTFDYWDEKTDLHIFFDEANWKVQWLKPTKKRFV